MPVRPSRSLSGAFSARAWTVGLAALCAAILIAGSGLVVYRRLCGRRLAEPPGPSYQRPDPLTPFTLLTLLRRIRQDQAVELGDADRRRLDESISGMERQFFDAPPGRPAPRDLDATADHWLNAVHDRRKQKRRSRFRPAQPVRE